MAKEESSPWGSILWGLVLIGVGVGSYFWFGSLEEEGGTIRTHALIILVYNLLGKNGVLGVFSLIGLVLLGVGLKGLASSK